MQVQRPISGQLAPCDCGRQPKHYESLGKELHHLECAPCELRTPKYPSFQLAVQAWETLHQKETV